MFIALGACTIGPPPPCFGLGVGSRVAITVVDAYTGNAAYPQSAAVPHMSACEFGLDLTQGEVLEATVESNPNSGGSCSAGVPSFAPSGGWTWTLQPGGGGLDSPTILEGEYAASNGPCSGSTGFHLRTHFPLGDIFAASARGQLPPAILERDFYPDKADASPAGCPAGCSGDFVVNLSRLP